MVWNNHKELEGKHAFMSASGYHWLNYDDATFEARYYSQYSQTIGTVIHQLAHDCIVNRIKINKHDVHLVELALSRAYIPKDAYDAGYILTNLIPFVNDAIGFHMYSEILLYYNQFCFGTTDAISYNERERTLRIHDLKSGSSVCKMEQLYIYAALFCLEYHVNPKDLSKIECRIYQNLEVLIDEPGYEVIEDVMNKIVYDTNLISTYLQREGR